MFKVGIVLMLLFLAMAPIKAGALSLGNLPVQSGGRVKPFDTLARESLQSIYGRQTYKSQPAHRVVWSWYLAPQAWRDVPLFLVPNRELQQVLELKNKYATWQQLANNTYLPLKLQQLHQKQDNKEKLGPFDQGLQNLEYSMQLFLGFQNGGVINIEPQAGEIQSGAGAQEAWRSVNELTPTTQQHFQQAVQSFVQNLKNKKPNKLSQQVQQLIDHLKTTYGAQYIRGPRVQIEVMYNVWRPFLWAWVLYLLGVLVVWASSFAQNTGRRKKIYFYSCVAFGVGLLLHIVGLLARVYIAQRPPVTNMYETVVWVALGAMVLALYFQHGGNLWRGRVLMLAAGSLSALCLILTDLSAQVLDARLDPLEPVLRDNFWLLTHVLVITLSYAAFFLAMVVGHVLLWQHLKKIKQARLSVSLKPGATPPVAASSVATPPVAAPPVAAPLVGLPLAGLHLIYKLVQVGVVLLSVGIILGGLWADVSWGRFWGWDPKETWALIALLGYVAWLHGRMSGWLRGFGQVVGVIVAFNLVIMAWYGVNFVLGAGLHTYGFGAGGLEWVLAFIVLQLIFVLYVTWARRWAR